MGSRLSRRTSTVAVDNKETAAINYPIVKAQREMQRSFNISLQKMVAHYTPSFFPMKPQISPASMKLCRDSWDKVVSKDVPDPYGGPGMSGLAACYTEFYERYKNIHTSSFYFYYSFDSLTLTG